MENITLDNIISDAKTIAVGGHIRPDGDCVGSTLFVYNYILEHYPEIKITPFLEDIPDVFEFLNGSDSLVDYDETPAEYDLFICLDCSDLSRLGKKSRLFESAKRTACIDHHLSNDSFADINYINPDASSTCELLCELVEMEKINKAMAECLYIGMVHDTGVFQYSCTHASTMRYAGILMEKGIDYPGMIDKTFYEMTFAQNQLLGLGLSKAKLYEDGKVIATYFTGEELKQFNATGKDTDSVVNQLRKTKGTQIAVFLYQNADGSYKGSLRTNADVNLVEIAKIYGGGGHAKAAGFTAEGHPENDIIPALIKKAKEQL